MRLKLESWSFDNQMWDTDRLNAQLHRLSVQLNRLVVVSFLVFLKSLSNQEVGSLQIHLLPGLQGVHFLN